MITENSYGKNWRDFQKKWQLKGLPSRSGLEKAAEDLREWKKKTGCPGLWGHPICLHVKLDILKSSDEKGNHMIPF